jgi:hypothetical protein
VVEDVVGAAGVGSKTAFGEGAPDAALVGTSCAGLVGVEDGVSGGDEVWSTWLTVSC